MNKIWLLLSALLLSACEKPMPFESAEFLAENPERLKELNLQCRADRSKLGDAQCNAVGDAQRIRFMGKGTPYTPYPVTSFSIPAQAPKVEAR
ncbi:EexN family lipoprotein [Pseudomonas lalucatii]|uniref:EexN family lipoprotein n=1 Tax=Pseudomonas lalucatii TaxID=1424203 RepID=A0ABS5PZ33_9PSED|nr:EexN family lipoprotein [Pseudomonas lalucatii]MBS7723987.1 EexN family lipoprotein [Pseudomonas lalucatii]QVM88009.1 EexN family lipoprotein [Pseudomonas lalucatii]